MSLDVLLVDNDPAILDALRVRFEALGAGITTVVNAAQAKGFLMAREFDVVITDVCMPGVGGIELAEEIREVSAVPILLMTAFPGGYADAFRHLPGVRMIPKPFAWDTLREYLAEMTSAPH